MKAIKKWMAMAVLLALVCALSGCAGKEEPFSHVPNPIATIELSTGKKMRFELFVQEAPNTVANFVQLATEGFYDGLSIFRIVPGAFVQTGSPDNEITGRSNFRIQGEFELNRIENSIAHTRGTISMCRQSDYDSASTQFFILQGNYPEFNGEYAAFGRATDAESLTALDELANTLTDAWYYPMGTPPSIISVQVETHGYRFEAARMMDDEDDIEEVSLSAGGE